MPNWCSTSIEIYHNSLDKLKFFDEKMAQEFEKFLINRGEA